jgi:hypothetical protein
MSSLQKFHRRTQSVGGPAMWPATVIGMGDSTHGFWLGGTVSNKLIVAPKSTEVSGKLWGSYGSTRNTVSTTNGLVNTNTLYTFGNSITTGHPAAYAAKSLTTGGYNTWYLPAKDELHTLYSNQSAIPFSTTDAFLNAAYWSSTEFNSSYAWFEGLISGYQGSYNGGYKTTGMMVRAIRRTTV